MTRRRPPLGDLHAFEAAARHLSFTSAAAELCVTQGAVSQRIRKLEELLGFRLFSRLPRELSLTTEGKILSSAVGNSLSLIDDALAGIFGQDAPDCRAVLTVSVAPSFASQWLVPRLSRFRQRCPELEICLEADASHADFSTGQVDLAIRFGRGVYPGLTTSLLMHDEVFPVCSPSLLAAAEHFEHPSDLLHAVLLHDATAEADGSGEDWHHWFLSAGLTVTRPDGPRFKPGQLALQAASAGLGVALGRASIVSDDLSAGRLIRPIDHAVPTAFSYYLVHQRQHVSPHLATFITWLRQEVDLWRPVFRNRIPDAMTQGISFVSAQTA
jgi:LysR family glycine cleavage system transcriptional activator